MTIQDFVESFYSRLRKEAESNGRSPPPAPISQVGSGKTVCDLIANAPLFVLGEGEEMVRVMRELRQDLIEDLADGLLTPFTNVTMACQLASGWALDWIYRVKPGEQGDRFLHVAFSEKTIVPGFPNVIEFEYGGGQNGQFLVHLAEETIRRYRWVDRARAAEVTLHELGGIVEDAMLKVALISHPSHYIVERTPALSPREEREAARGEPRPLRKRPHFIVIDHDELTQLNPSTRISASGHRPPVPHARRGHWMRLSERCQHARAEGRTRVWVRETYVGEREFSDGKTSYRVYLSPQHLSGNA